MNNFKQRVEYLAHSYIGIARRFKSWEKSKELIERDPQTAEAVKKRIKELLKR